MTFLEVAVIIAEKEDRVKDSSYLLMLIDRIRLWRNTIIRQTIKANPNDISYYLTAYNLELEKVPSYEAGYDVGCDILRTKNKIYKSLRASDYLYMVGNIDFTVSFSKANNDINVSLNRKYTKKDVFYIVRNEYIYIYNDMSITNLGILDCLELPEQIELDKNKELNLKDLEIQTTEDIIQKIISAIWSEDLKIRDNSEEETLNSKVK